jgi:signal transduction histidine kinase
MFNSAHGVYGTILDTQSRRPARWRLLWLLMLLPGWYVPTAAEMQHYESKSVLILYSHERELSTYAELDRALRSTLQSDSTHAVAFYTEYLDLLRFPEERRQRMLMEYLRIKYSTQQIDLVVLVSPLAFNFFNKYGESLFPGIPAVFTSVGIQRLANVPRKPNVTGVAVTREVRDTLDFALQLQPDTRRVIIPSGSSSIEKSWTEETLKALSPYSKRLSIIALRDLTMNELLAELKTLPPHTIVLFATSYFHDASGNYFLPEDALALITESSNAPVYGTNEPYLGRGIVGGSLYNMAEPGQAAGIIGKRILSGEKVANIPIQTIDPNHFMVDARQLKRWNIAESKLPHGTLIRFKQQPAWEPYKWYILAAFILVALQSWLIFTLVLQRLKLKRSEATLKDLSRHLITIQEEERKRIARELHDDFGQRLALLKIDLEILGRNKGQIQNLNENETMESLLANVTDLAKDMQDLSHRLHSSKLQYLGLKGALADLCRQISKQHQIEIDLKVADLSGAVPDDLALCFYRVAQEALHNAAKHSGAQHAVVTLSVNSAVLFMLITDDGQGFDQEEASLGLGLASMRERLQMMGGSLWLFSRRGRGTELAAEAPLAESSRQFKVS